MAWLGSGLVTLLIVVAIVQAFERSRSNPMASTIEDNNGPTSSPTNEVPAEANDSLLAVPPRSHEKLSALGHWLGEQATQTGAYPQGVLAGLGPVPDEGWSWISQYVADTQPPLPLPQSTASWREPANDRFVRRRMNSLLINEKDGLVGVDGYPATQLVGVAGVGVDGPTLPVDAAMAGVFAYGRTTRQKDILDGLSQTAMVASVQRKLGSWASGGLGSIRPLTASPVIDGPDGFGVVGQPGLLLLMADGSVRELPPETNDLVVRRMFTIAEGVDLNDSSPGDPVLFPPRETPVPQLSSNPTTPSGGLIPQAAPDSPVAETTIPVTTPGQDTGTVKTDVPVGSPPQEVSAPMANVVAETDRDVTANLEMTLQRFRTGGNLTRRQIAKSAADFLGAKMQLADDASPEDLKAVLDGGIDFEREHLTVRELLDTAFKGSGGRWTLLGSTLRIGLENVPNPKNLPTPPNPEN
jgi:hypothetical protein